MRHQTAVITTAPVHSWRHSPPSDLHADKHGKAGGKKASRQRGSRQVGRWVGGKESGKGDKYWQHGQHGCILALNMTRGLDDVAVRISPTDTNNENGYISLIFEQLFSPHKHKMLFIYLFFYIAYNKSNSPSTISLKNVDFPNFSNAVHFNS